MKAPTKPRAKRSVNPADIHIDINSHNTKGRNVRAKNPVPVGKVQVRLEKGGKFHGYLDHKGRDAWILVTARKHGEEFIRQHGPEFSYVLVDEEGNIVGRPGLKARAKNPSSPRLTIEGRRWFQRTNGNTYHAARVYLGGKLVYTSPIRYGYGEQYVVTGLEEAIEAGLLPAGLTSVRKAEEAGYSVDYFAEDVKTKRDLAEFAAPKAKARTRNPARKVATMRPSMRKVRYCIVLMKRGAKSPYGYWTGKEWDTEKAKAHYYLSAEKCQEKAQALANVVSAKSGFKVGVMSVPAPKK